MRCKWQLGGLLFCCVFSFATIAEATLVELNPIDADSIKPYQDSNYNSKAYVYSYYRNDPLNKHVGYLKFDLSSIPDGSTIDSMTLKLYTEIAWVTPGQPANIYRTSNDSWSSTTADLYPGTDELLGADQVITLSFSPYTWVLDVDAFNPQTDLTDNLLSLGITSTGYFNWFALDGLNFSKYPLLSINYSPASIPGDANGDTYVDGGDYTLWANNFLQTGQTWEDGDFTGEGIVDGADYTIWANNFAPAPLLSPAAVPEPSALALAAIGALGLAGYARRHRGRAN